MDQYRVYGNPIKQSRSPFIHQLFAEMTNQQLSYQKELVAIDKFQQAINDFITSGGYGANITVPFKEDALLICDHLTQRAELAGAVNTLSFKNGEIYGDNTDGVGLVNDLKHHKVVLNNARVLILGAGGATKGVILPLLEQDIAHLVIANRTLSKAQDIANKYNEQPISVMSFEQTADHHFDLIINATSASLSGENIPVPESIIGSKTVCYDMVYGKELTPFLLLAKRLGAQQIIDGLGMLVEQAAESFYIWRAVKPQTNEVLVKLRSELQRA